MLSSTHTQLSCAVTAKGNLPEPRHHDDDSLNHKFWQSFYTCSEVIMADIKSRGLSFPEDRAVIGSPSITVHRTKYALVFDYELPKDLALRQTRLKLILGYLSECKRQDLTAEWRVSLVGRNIKALEVKWDSANLCFLMPT